MSSHTTSCNILPFLNRLRIATILTSERSTDGVSRLLSKADLERLKLEKAKPLAKVAECLGLGFLFGKSLGTEFAKDKCFFLMGTMIASLRELLQDSWSMMKRTSEEANHYGAFGRLCCRVCLFLTNKQRLSRENVEYHSLTEIAAIFTKELKDGPPVAAPSETVVERSVDVLTASGTEKALLQNQHLKMGEMHHG